MDLKKTVEACNEECWKCKLDFEKAKIDFSHSMCKFCQNGKVLHEALCQISAAEKQWDEQYWGSSKLKDLYKG